MHLTHASVSLVSQIHHPHHASWKWSPRSQVSLTWFTIWHYCLITDKTQRKWTLSLVFNCNYRNFVRGASIFLQVNYWQSSLLFSPTRSTHSCLSILLDFDGCLRQCSRHAPIYHSSNHLSGEKIFFFVTDS